MYERKGMGLLARRRGGGGEWFKSQGDLFSDGGVDVDAGPMGSGLGALDTGRCDMLCVPKSLA